MTGMRMLLAAMVGGFLATQGAMAQGLLGTSHIGAQYSITQLGDDELDDLLGNVDSVGAFGQLNIAENLDLLARAADLWADGSEGGVDVDVDERSATLTGLLSLRPGETINPFVAGLVGVIDSEVDVTVAGVNASEDATDAVYGVGAGVEAILCSRAFARIGATGYRVSSDNYLDLGASVGVWLTDAVLVGLGGTYETEEEDVTGTVSLVFKLN